MKKIFFMLLVVTLVTQSILAQETTIEDVFKMKMTHSLISRGDNYPNFNSNLNGVRYLLTALHKNIPITDFQQKMKFSDDKIDSITDALIKRNYLHKINGVYKPTLFIADSTDGAMLYKYAKPISKDIVKQVEKSISSIKRDFSETSMYQKQGFEHWSFFLLSNVLLDNWQINSVEEHFLKVKERPLRHGKYYYNSLQQLQGKVEPFGIYGNQVGNVSVYGNNRHIVNVAETDNVILEKDYQILNKIASDFLPNLLKVLEKNRKYAEQVYKKTGYSNEITFNEFFIWWYHFIYTQSTNMMADKNLLKLPKDGNFAYR